MVRERDSRLGWWPPAELLLAPVIVIVLLNVLTPTAAFLSSQADVLVYLHKAEALARGEVPYRDFPFEYPPLALLAMAIPYFAWPWRPVSLESYRWLFTAWESLLLVGLVIVASRIAHQLAREFAPDNRVLFTRSVGLRVLVLVIAVAPSIAWRFDLLPAVLAALAILLALEGRAALAGLALGLGVLAKVYPLVLVPALAAVWLAPVDRRQVAGFGASLMATTSMGLLLAFLIAGDRAWGFVTYQADRGLQIETVPAGLILLVRGWTGGRVPVTFGSSSVQVAGTAANVYLAVQPWLSLICVALLAALTLVLYRREMRSKGAVQPSTVVATAATFILVLLVTNRVFSVQYIVWLLPLAAFLSRGQFRLALVIGALSIGIHPLFYSQLIAQDPAVVWLLNIRNGLVVALLAWVLSALVGMSAGKGANGLFRQRLPSRPG